MYKNVLNQYIPGKILFPLTFASNNPAIHIIQGLLVSKEAIV